MTDLRVAGREEQGLDSVLCGAQVVSLTRRRIEGGSRSQTASSAATTLFEGYTDSTRTHLGQDGGRHLAVLRIEFSIVLPILHIVTGGSLCARFTCCLVLILIVRILKGEEGRKRKREREGAREGRMKREGEEGREVERRAKEREIRR